MDRRVRWAILGGLVVLFCVSGPILVFYSMGYRLRLGSAEGKTTIRFEERGLILLESTPPGATVSIDGSLTKLKTPTSIYRPAPSECTIALQLAGHHSWSRTFQVTPQTVIRTETIILPPATISSKLVTSMPVSSFALSADGRWLAFGDATSAPSLWLKETGSADEVVKIPSYTARMFQPKSSIERIEFSQNNRAALLTVKVSESSAPQIYWVLLRDPYEMARVDDIVAGAENFCINPRAVQQVFVVADGRLSRVDAKERTVKADISRNVEFIEVGEDSLWLLKKGDRTVYVRPFNSNEPDDDKALLECDAKSPFAVAKGRRLVVDGSRNVSLLAPQNGALLRDDTNKLTHSHKASRAIAFSPDHRFVAVADDRSVSILDAFPIRGALFEWSAEPQKKVLAPYRAEDGPAITQIFWWDDSAHLLVRRGNLLELIETDTPLGGHCHVLLDDLPEDSPLSFDAKEAVVFFTRRAETDSAQTLLYSARLRAPAKGMLDWLIKPKPPAPSATLSAP